MPVLEPGQGSLLRFRGMLAMAPGKIMRWTLSVLILCSVICAAGHQKAHAAGIAPLTGIAARPDHLIPVYSHRYRHGRPYIVVPLTPRYGYEPYWWPQGQYHWSPFGVERWGFWCEGSGAHRLSC
jgi:hypothetical protein